MKMFRSMIASLAALAILAATPALAQYAPGSTVLDAPQQLRTYRASIIGLAPASSATDILVIPASTAGTPIRVRSIKCNGVSTANASALLQVIKRSTADTGGTSSSLTSVRLNANQPVSNVTIKAYTANPTLGTAIGTIDAGYLTTNTLATSTVNNQSVVFDFTNQNLWIVDSATVLALNANGASFTSGASLNCTVEWTE